MPQNNSENIIYLNSETGIEQIQNTSGWYQKNNNIIRKQKSNLDIERNKTLRVKDSNIQLSGVIRYNSSLQQFQGYTDSGWVAFQNTNGQNGQDGVNSISEFVGNNISTDSEAFGIFKDIISETVSTTTVAETVVDNQIENIFTAPAFAFSDFRYGFNPTEMELAGKNLIFKPTNSYRVFVRNNESYPPVNYYGHQKIRDLNFGKISPNNHYRHYMGGAKFPFYNTEYDFVYIHENGYLNFVGGDTSLLTGSYVNHFTSIRLSAFLNNLENTSNDDDVNRADVYVGVGPYGETVITYNNFSAVEIDPNDALSTIKDNYNNFQIRLWTNNVTYDSSAAYRDDNYPVGTIQISYGKCEHLTPLVGLSNQQPYDETSFVPIPYSNFLDSEYTETTGQGVPKLEATFILKISDTTQAAIIQTKFNELNQFVQSSDVSRSDTYKLIVKNTNWASSFSEKENGITYYSRIVDFGNISALNSFYVVLKGLHDIGNSDINNRTSGMDLDLLDSSWQTTDLTTLIDMTTAYSATYTKDYQTIYTQNAYNVAESSNTYLHAIQMKYVDINQESTSGTNSTRLYTGSTEKRLFIKIIYRLKSDEEKPVGNNSFANAALISLPTLTTSFTIFSNGGNSAFNFIPGSDDYFEFSLDLSKSYQIELFDNSPDSAARNNFGLGFEIYRKSLDSNTEPSLYKSITNVDLSNNLNSYPANLIDKQFETSDANSVRTFYLKISSNIKSYFYGIRIKVSTSPTLTTNILTFTILDTNYNLLSTSERDALKSTIKALVRDTVSNDSITGTENMEVVLERVVTSSGDRNILVTVILGSVDLGEIQSVATNLAATITFTLEETSVTKNINNPTANTISISNKPTDTIPTDDGAGAPGAPNANDYTSKDILTLMKAAYLQGEVNMHSFPQQGTLVNYFDKYYHTTIELTDGKILYCYFSLNLSPSSTGATSQELRLKVFYQSPNDIFNDIVVDTLTYSNENELNNYPFNIFNQNNKIVVLYGIKDNTQKNLILKQYSVTISTENVISITLINNTYSLKATVDSANYANKQNTINKYNTGVVDSDNNIYMLEIDSIWNIVKFNTSLAKTEFNIYGSGNIAIPLRLYNTEDRFTSSSYLYVMQQQSLGNNIYDHTVTRINKNQKPDIPIFYTGPMPQQIGIIKADGTIYFDNADVNNNNLKTDYEGRYQSNFLPEVRDFAFLENYFFAINKTGNMIRWGNTNSVNNYSVPTDLVNVKDYNRNFSAIAFLVNDVKNSEQTVVSFGSHTHGGGNYRSKYNDSTSIYDYETFSVGTNISQIYANAQAFTALTTTHKLETWGEYYENTNLVQDKDSGGNFTQYTTALLTAAGVTDVNAELTAISQLNFVNVFYTQNSFAGLTDGDRLYTWGNKYQSHQGNTNPTDSNVKSTSNIYLATVKFVKTTMFSYAVLVEDSNFTANSALGKPSYQVNCFGGQGIYSGIGYGLLSPDPPGTDSINYSDFDNYGEYFTYYDYDLTSNNSGVATFKTYNSNENTNIKTLHSNKYAFAALIYESPVVTTEAEYQHKVITWGLATQYTNYGGAPYYRNVDSQGNDVGGAGINFINISAKLASGVKDVVSNDFAFLAIKKEEIVVWGKYDSGGGPYLVNYDGSSTTYHSLTLTDTFYHNLSASNIIPSRRGFAIYKNNTVRFIGYVEDISSTTEITNVESVQTDYTRLYAKNKFLNEYTNTYDTVDTHTFTIVTYTALTNVNQFEITKFIDVANGASDPSSSFTFTNNFNPQDHSTNQSNLITLGLNRYDYVPDYAERDTLLFGCLGDDYYYLKLGSVSPSATYSLYRNRNATAIVNFPNITSSDHILQFEFLTANSKKYLILVYQDTGNNRFLELVELNDFLGDIKKLNDTENSPSVSNLDGIKLIHDKLLSYYFDNNSPTFVGVDSFSLNSPTRLTPADDFIDVYVSAGDVNNPPYYNFYLQSDGTSPLTILDLTKKYRFRRLNNATTHPFYISDNGYGQNSTNKITLTGDGSASTGITGTQTFTLEFNNLTSSDYLYYYCTSHNNMSSMFSLTTGTVTIAPISYNLGTATQSYKIYNDNTTNPTGSTAMPNNYDIVEMLGNAITTDITTSKLGFFMIARNNTLVNANTDYPKFNYFLFQYDEHGNSRSLDTDSFNQFHTDSEDATTIQEEDVIVKDPDTLELKDTIQDSITSTNNIQISSFQNDSLASVYQSGNTLYLKVYNEYDFLDSEVSQISTEIYNLSISTHGNQIDIRWQDSNKFTIKRYQVVSNDENNSEDAIELVLEKEILLVDNTTFNYTVTSDNQTYLVYNYQENETETKTKIDRLETDASYLTLASHAMLEIQNISYSQNILYLWTEGDKFYEFDIANSVITEKNLTQPILYKSVLVTQSGEILYFVQKENICLTHNQEVVLDLGINDVSVTKFEMLDETSLVCVYEKDNKKTIILYSLLTQEFVRYQTQFEFLVRIEDRFLLVDARKIRNQITVRYLNKKLEVLNLNIFENNDYTFDNLDLIDLDSNKVIFWGKKLDSDDIETSYVYERLEYVDVSQGQYSTHQYLSIPEEQSSAVVTLDSENIQMEVEEINFFSNLSSSRNAPQGDSVIVLVADVYITGGNYLIEQVLVSGTGEGLYNSQDKYLLKEGTYILKDVPSTNPLAILVKHATGDKNMISYRGLSYNNINLNNVGASLVNQVTEDTVTHSYYFYYGDIEIKVLGDFGEVSFHSYNNGYMGGLKKLKYDASITRPSENESNLIYERDVNDRTPLIPFSGADPQNSNFVIGRAKNVTYDVNDNDSGSVLYAFVKSYYDYQQEDCLYLRSNGIPNYQPSMGGVVLQGNWSNEKTNLQLGSKLYYSPYYHHRGWLDTNNNVLGNMYKIPLEPQVATQNIYTSPQGIFNENFWYQDDLYWKTIMEDTQYNVKLFTPMGPLGVALNGISFYNFAINQNTVTESYESSQLTSGNFNYLTSSPIITTLSTNNSQTVINGVENTITNTQAFDSQGGAVDLNHHYHYHYYPIALEGLITFGTVSNRVYNEVFAVSAQVSNTGFKMFIGHTYYLNVSDHTHLDDTNQNLYLGFASHLDSFQTEYRFENTLIRNGEPGVGVGSYVKFTVPTTFTTSHKLQLVHVKNNLSSSSAANTLITSYGAYYNTGGDPSIECAYRPLTIKLSIVAGKFVFKNASDVAYDNSANKLYFEKDILYTITLDASYTSSGKTLGVKKIVGSNISVYNPTVFTNTANPITLRFNSEESGLIFYNVNDDTDDSGSNYSDIGVYLPESIHYYARVFTDTVANTVQYLFYQDNSLNNFNFNGMLEWEDAYSYLTEKKSKYPNGSQGHSPLLGYAFDGFPIYGPLGFDKSNGNYFSTDLSTIPVKFLRSSYTTTQVDSNNNPTYNPNLTNGDLDFCNGIFSKTPEFPQGIYHYVCTIQLNADGTPFLETQNIGYNFRNITKPIIKPAYPYVIGAYKGIPEIYNFPWANSKGAISNTNIEKKKFTFNFKSIKSEEVSVNGKTQKSISITQDPSNLNLLVNPQNYQFNFSSTTQTSIFGRDGLSFGNKISDLVSSTTTDTVFKAFGKVNKWVGYEAIERGTCVTITYQVVDSVPGLYVKTYSQIGLSEQQENVDVLGIALNDTTTTGQEVYVCQEGITTVRIANTLNVNCSSYGIMSSVSETTGRVVALGQNNNILGNTPVVGTFLETKSVTAGDYILFKVKTNYEFN